MAENTITNMSLLDWLDDLTVRFLLNLPQSELSSVPRLCFQVEEAQWFYEDFIRPAAAASGQPLPSLPLRQFCLQLFQHCPLLSGFTDAQHIAAYEEFLAYKVRVPVRGAILMDEGMEKLVLVKGWKKGASWSFPRGKINKDEKDLDCAIREVYEETGFDVRGAGLVPEDEEEVKYIDVTMREQHMRLFVFRGVKEDTYFEPQTRKEISKIQWYNVRDLPGFKKHKHGAQESSNKFYMVAPFLGPLKKWINQQRRQDAQEDAQIAAPENDMAHAHLDTEGDVSTAEQDLAMPEPELVDNRSAELRRLLSIGTQATENAPQQQMPPAPSNGANQTHDLLALLRGGPPRPSSNVPQTPFNQINAFPQQPQTPQPHHPRHPSVGIQQPVPQFPFSPQRLEQQQQQRNYSVPTPGVFGQSPGGFSQPSQQQRYHGSQQLPPGYAPLNRIQPHQQRQSMPGPHMQGPKQHFGQQQNGTSFNVPHRQPVQPPPQAPQHGLPPTHLQHQNPRPSDASFVAPQGQGAIGGGPSVPKADALPMPKLNPNAMNLLNAFKSGNNKPAAPSAAGQQAPRQASQHQSALLDLLRKSSTAPSTAPPVVEPTSPTLTDATEKPDRPVKPMQKRKPTLNEITRTLPAKFKAKSPLATQSMPTPTLQSPMQTPVAPVEAAAERPKSRGQLYDPANPKPTVRSSSRQARQPEQQTVPILQRPPSQHAARTPKPARSPKAKARGVENGAPQPQQQTPAFTILARPGSIRGQKSPGLVPEQAQRASSSPLRNETPKPAAQQSQGPPVQVLKRPESVDPAAVQAAAEAVEENTNGIGGQDKREQLLALFGKGSGVSSPSPAAPTPAAPNAVEAKKNNLLNLFTGAPANSAAPRSATATPTAPTPTLMQPPPPPQIAPERNPSRQSVHQHQRQQTPQNALLDLFNRPAATSNKLDSPNTPISPFTLGTPAQRHAPMSLAGTVSHQHHGSASALAEEIRQGGTTPTPMDGAQRSRLGSVASAAGSDGVSGSRKTSGAGTPVEAKGFLLDYLNGVVKKEGYRGAGARRG